MPQSFLKGGENYKIQSEKRDATKINGKKVQTIILTDYKANLHQKYLAKLEHELSLATFCGMRPNHVLLTSCLNFESHCLSLYQHIKTWL